MVATTVSTNFPPSPSLGRWRSVRPPSNFTPSGCEIPTHGLSYAPLSTALVHSSECACTCHEDELAAVREYVLAWVSYRMDKLGESPVQATAWARISCLFLDGLEGMGRRLDHVEAAATVLSQWEGDVCWSVLFS